MKAKRTQHGFSPIIVIVAIAIIVALGFEIYFAFSRHKSELTLKSPVVSTPQTETPATSTPVVSGNDFKLVELKLEFPISDGIKDLKYAPYSGINGSYGLATSSMKSWGDYCSAQNGALGILRVASLTDIKQSEKKYPISGSDQYLVYTTPQSLCQQNTSNQAESQAQINDITLLEDAFAQAKALK